MLFQHGTDIMSFERGKFAHLPPVTPHYEASLLGRDVGLEFADLIENS